jgi:DNA-binding protein H-NS
MKELTEQEVQELKQELKSLFKTIHDAAKRAEEIVELLEPYLSAEAYIMLSTDIKTTKHKFAIE